MPRIHVLLDQLASSRPHHALLLEPDTTTSAAALQAMSQALADEWAAAGVVAGDRVLLVAENCAAHIAAIMACSRLGAWSCGLNARLTAAELAAFAAKADARLACYTVAASPDAAQHAQAVGAQPSAAVSGMASSAVRAASPATPQERAQEVAAIIFTSGTTGSPKGVLVSHQGLMHFAQVSSRSRGLTPQDRIYACLPMSHIFGLATVLMAALAAGSSLVLRCRFEPDDLSHALAHLEVSNLLGPPTLFSRWLAHLQQAGVARPHAPRLRYAYTGSAPMDMALKARVEAVLGLPLHHGYGLSEYAGSLILTSLAPDGAPRRDQAVGFLAEGAELRIVDGQGQDLPTDQAGEIWIRGPGLMPGYWRDADATAAVMRPGGWYATGDLGRIDAADGAVFIVGRLKEMIIRSGFNVYPAEVEGALLSFGHIALAAVVGEPEADGNERVVAYVEMQAGHLLDEPALQQHLASRLAPYKRPARVVVLPAMPMTANGKLLKRGLRQAAEAAGITPDPR